MEMIRVPDMLKTMQQYAKDGGPLPFSITFVTCDQKNNVGGEKITLNEAVMLGNGKSNSTTRNPNHFQNYTRNIRAKDGDRIMKVHVLLITRFNGKRIIL